MKKTLILALGLLLFAASANACPSIGLFTDGNHSFCSATSPGGFFPIEMWIWCLPGPAGIKCVEFAIQYPASVIPSTVTQNIEISVAQGALNTGMSCCYENCQTGWTWTHHQTCYLTATAADYIRVIPHPVAGGPQFATCANGYPIEAAYVLNHLALNQQCIIAVQNTSWGAIKSLYN